MNQEFPSTAGAKKKGCGEKMVDIAHRERKKEAVAAFEHEKQDSSRHTATVLVNHKSGKTNKPTVIVKERPFP